MYDPQPPPRDTRNLILDAAETVVARMGVAAMTFEEVAKEAGISKGGVLYHFRSKEALTEAMIERFIERFDTAVTEAATQDAKPVGRTVRAYVRATVGEPPLTGELFDRANGAITAAMAKFPERLEPVRRQSDRSQAAIEADATLEPIFATIIRLAVDGLWLAENFNLMRFPISLKAAIAERLLAWTELHDLPHAPAQGGPALHTDKADRHEQDLRARTPGPARHRL